MLQTVFCSQVMEPLQQASEIAPSVRVLIVDNDPTIRSACEEVARTLGYTVESTNDRHKARTLLCQHAADILLLNVPPGDPECLELVSDIRTLCPNVVIVGMTTSATINSVVDAMRLGASDYLVKPFAVDELSTVLARAATTFSMENGSRQLRDGLCITRGFGGMIGHSEAM